MKQHDKEYWITVITVLLLTHAILLVLFVQLALDYHCFWKSNCFICLIDSFIEFIDYVKNML